MITDSWAASNQCASAPPISGARPPVTDGDETGGR
jgi:hypothetical protein